MVAPGRHGPFRGRLATDVIAAYATATGDRTPAVRDGLAVPAVFPVILVFTAQEAARADLPSAVWHRVRGGVHGEHDIVFHRPLVPGEPLDTYSRISAIRTSRAGTHVVVHLAQVAADGQVAVDQWWTMILLGLNGLGEFGDMPADHRFPDLARRKPLGSLGQHIDAEVAHRYAEVSGDWAPHHFDLEAAQAAGFDFVFTHGLCTMAVCTHLLQRRLGIDDPRQIARVAVRFASPTPLDAELTVDAYEIDSGSFAFEATSRDVLTITHGRLELRS